jgi:Uma2 family endonuclease
MPPCGGGTGRQESELLLQLGMWSRRDGTGVVFSSSTGFRLPGGAQRSPDASWVRRDRWDALSAEEQETFPPIVPDFVAELRFKTDSLPALRAKMREYIDCGARLGWLIDPQDHRVEIFRPGREPEIIENPPTVSAEPELPGFSLELQYVWS